MSRILALLGGASPLDRERSAAWVELLARLADADTEGPVPETAPGTPEILAALATLAGKGLLSFAAATATAEGEPIAVFYTASAPAVESVLAAEPASGFPEPVRKKQAEAFRASQGAILRFPFAEGGDPATAAVEVFITDWSPCPAAAAIAIHPDHPLAVPEALADAGAPPPAPAPRFTGRYVRHPLTGDLLPVWVADWVRPDFGTGAVLVNPAHDATDLAFGRAIGLPIRFALVPPGFDGSPAAWLTPPVVKTGVTYRTGPYDGLSAGEAMERYFAVLAERGLARRTKDLKAGRVKLGELSPDPSGELAWDPVRRRLTPAAEAAPGARGVRLAAEEVLTLTLSAPVPVGVVCQAGEQAKGLLALRLLAFDLYGAPFTASPLLLVQKAQAGGPEASPEAVRLALLVGAPAGQVAVLKQQVLEQAQKFLRVHGELLAAAPPELDSGDASPAALAKVKEATLKGDSARAFSFLQQQQKQLAALPPEGRSAGDGLAAYFAGASMVAGLPGPARLDAGRLWRAA
jgi:leucyl-tRNA synthetase